MSFQAMAWAVKQRVGNATGKAILLMLANYADEEGRCFPSQSKLAVECECSERTVRDWLTKFESFGMLSRDERRRLDGRRTSDTIILSMASHPADAPGLQPANIAGSASPANAAADPSPAGDSGSTSPAGDSGSTSPAGNSDFTGSSCRAINYQRTYQDSVGKRTSASSEFDEVFWPAYPHKVGKGEARAAWTASRRKADLQTIMHGLKRYEASKPERIAWCNPATWLNGERWLDEPGGRSVRSALPKEPSANQRILNELYRRHSNHSTAGYEGPIFDGYSERS